MVPGTSTGYPRWKRKISRALTELRKSIRHPIDLRGYVEVKVRSDGGKRKVCSAVFIMHPSIAALALRGLAVQCGVRTKLPFVRAMQCVHTRQSLEAGRGRRRWPADDFHKYRDGITHCRGLGVAPLPRPPRTGALATRRVR